MRAILIAALVAGGIGLAGTSGAVAAPANGIAIDEAASAVQTTEQVRYHRYHRGYYHRHHHWRRWHWGHRHRHCVHRRFYSGRRCW